MRCHLKTYNLSDIDFLNNISIVCLYLNLNTYFTISKHWVFMLSFLFNTNISTFIILCDSSILSSTNWTNSASFLIDFTWKCSIHFLTYIKFVCVYVRFAWKKIPLNDFLLNWVNWTNMKLYFCVHTTIYLWILFWFSSTTLNIFVITRKLIALNYNFSQIIW